jgi:hypothetical protein
MLPSPRFHRSSIHHLLAAFLLLNRDFEVVDPYLPIELAPPGSLTTRMAPNKDTARAEMEEVVR